MRCSVAIVTAASLLALAAPAVAQDSNLEPVPGQPVPGTPAPLPADPTVTVPPADAPAAPAPAPTPAQPAQQGEDRGLAWLTVGLIALAVILAAILIVIALWRVRGWDPLWLRRWRHATAEAGWRISLGAAELRDFVRLGR
jgi:hypothetical protein